MAKTVPLPVQLAQEALEILKNQGIETADLAKSLPAYALQLEKSGQNLTVNGLLEVARDGAEHLKARIGSSRKTTEKFEPLAAYTQTIRSLGCEEPVEKAYVPNTRYLTEELQEQFLIACITGDIRHVKLCIDKGVDVTTDDDTALRYAQDYGFPDIAKLLFYHGIAIHDEYESIIYEYDVMKGAAKYGYMSTIQWLTDHGVSSSILEPYQKAILNDYTASVPVWQKNLRINPPNFIYNENPAYFKKSCFETVLKMLDKEGYNYYEPQANQMAFHAAGLFQSEQNILKYLKKWGRKSRQPLHDLIQMIKLPKDGTPNLKDWSDAVLKCGPSMAKLVKYADKLPSPMKSSDGRTWSMVNTRAECAKFAFNNAAENPKLAALCMEYNVDDNAFDTALGLVKAKTPAVKNIPDISINGEKFDMAGAKFYRLPAGDIRGLFLGEMTACCQSIGGVGAECAEHGYTSPDSGFYVVENAKGKIIAETWAWRGDKGEMCFDSLETLGQNVTAEQWAKILTESALELTTSKDHDITALHVGRGGGTPKRTLQNIFAKCAVAEPKNYTGYRDSKGEQILVWKR